MDSARRPFFTAGEEDEYDGEATLESMIPGFSGIGTAAQNQSHSLDHRNLFSSRPMMGSLRNIPYMGSPVSSPRSGRFHYDPRLEDQRTHFLDSCALCKKPLGNHRDIFMYRGDTAFCSEECRQEQIEMDEAKEQNHRNLSSLRKKNDQRKSSTTSPSKSQDCPLRSGTVAAA